MTRTLRTLGLTTLVLLLTPAPGFVQAPPPPPPPPPPPANQDTISATLAAVAAAPNQPNKHTVQFTITWSSFTTGSLHSVKWELCEYNPNTNTRTPIAGQADQVANPAQSGTVTISRDLDAALAGKQVYLYATLERGGGVAAYTTTPTVVVP